ncbi:Asp/Glu/hydantoin racemase [Roseomonas arctica]|uniref:Asp/Glu/hydantoin racemase n=2 Tax=Plastoroseomonas arctica TaxID=1509237 RepID=A0AAF1JX54_9PROT|nr:Asp/Glu/hydantoin racemase [Plastoroseomonas arctica]
MGGTRLGMLTPSSNTVLEPATAWLLAGTPHTTAHFQRLRVLRIGMDPALNAQFDTAPMVAAAEFLADAQVHALCWNGTSGSWLGLDADRAFCAAATAATGLPCITATLALHDALAALGARRIALVTPYLAEIQDAIVANFAAAGIATIAERHLEDPGNFSFAGHPAAKVDALVREVAAERPDAIIIHCTNFRGTEGAAAIEAETGVPVLDSIAVSLWGALRAAGAPTAPLARHGRLFTL